jgi:hypothetical protein
VSQREMLVDNVTDRLRLEAGIVGERWQRLKEATVRVQNHKDAFRRECALLGSEKQALEAERAAFEAEVRDRWPAAALDDDALDAQRVTVNVGGAVFETTAGVLTRDRFSVLAALCTDRPPVPVDRDSGAFFFDRDGALFQHIVNFLRDDVLPEDNMVLRGLYTESSFYRLGLLRRAVEARFEMVMARAEQTARAQQMGALGYAGTMGMGGNSMGMGGNSMGGMGMGGMGMGGMSMLQQQQIAARGQNAFSNVTGAGFVGKGAVAAGAAAGAAAAGSSSSANTSTTAAASSAAARSAQMNMSLPPKLQMLHTSQPRAAVSSLPDPFGFTSSVGAMRGMGQSQVGIPGASFANTYRDDFGY